MLAEEQNGGEKATTVIASGRGELRRHWETNRDYRIRVKLSKHLAGLGRSELSTLFRRSTV